MRNFLLVCSALTVGLNAAFTVDGFAPSPATHVSTTILSAQRQDNEDLLRKNRRDILATLVASGGVLLYSSSSSAAPEQDVSESFASIAARANTMSKEVGATRPSSTNSMIRPTDKTVYDFNLPIEGAQIPFKDIVRQEFQTKLGEQLKDKDGNPITYQDVKVKAIVLVNIKQDDPVARKDIPELISLAAKYGRGSEGSLAIVACPTDQGYYEPDTSQLIRLKLASEYGYGINPSTIVTDKVNLLGTGSVPVWRWIQSTCRTPAGLGRIEGNFEKFLIDGRTGLPVRRYPRKYRPLNMADDIEALIAGKPLPPARANFLEEWRQTAAEAERDTYRFEKGLNVFDQ
jgi:glutathione peroxidase-family protein